MPAAFPRSAASRWLALPALPRDGPARVAALILLFGVVYGVTAKIGLTYSSIAPNVTLIWPPTGISLFVVLRYGYRLWPGIVLGDLLANAGTGAPIPSVLGIAAGNLIETFVCAWLLQRWCDFRATLDRVRDVTSLLALGSACAALSAFVGPASLALGGAVEWHLYWSVWLQWLMGDATGVVVLTPLLLAWSGGARETTSGAGRLEAVALAVALILVCEAVFGGLGLFSHGYYPASLAIFPLAVWAALRFGLKGATATTLLVSIAAVWGTVLGKGPFVVAGSVDSLVRWWVFVNVITVTSLLLAASRRERGRVQEQLQRERDFVATILDTADAVVVVLDRASTICRVNRAFETLTGRSAAELIGQPFVRTCIVPAHWEKMEAGAELLRLRISNVARQEAELLRRHGAPRLVSWSSAVVREGAGRIEHLIVTGIDVTEHTLAAAALRRARSELEVRVAQRTSELAQSNASLIAEMGERRRLEREIIHVAEQEQRRIGQELHDGLGQHLTAVAFLSEVLAARLAESGMGEAANAAEIERMVSDAVSQTRLLARGLFPVELEPNGLMSALEELARNTQRLFGLACEFHCAAPVLVPDSTVAINLHRIAQEAVNNAVKHSGATHIRIELARHDGAASLSVRDDGRGLRTGDAASAGGLGLRIMTYRAALIGARLHLEPSGRGGLAVRVVLPPSSIKEDASDERRAAGHEV
jgi:PAS domain S-box-containing protein